MSDVVPVIRRRRGVALPAGVVYVGRPSRWGNPYRIGRTMWLSETEVRPEGMTRAETIHAYRVWIDSHPELIRELAVRKPTALACWCAPLPCHADVLVELLTEAVMA